MTLYHTTLPDCIVPTPQVVLEAFVQDFNGAYTLVFRAEYRTLGHARAGMTGAARRAVLRKDSTDWRKYRWVYGKDKDKLDEFVVDQSRMLAYIMRTSQYDPTTQRYVTVDQFEFGP